MKIFSQPSTTRKTRTPIVEFVGSPGVGKTTNCRHFAKILEAKGLHICDAEDLKAYVKKLGKLRKLTLYTTTLLQNSFKLLHYTTILAQHQIYSPNAVYRFLRLSVFQAALQQLLKSRQTDLVLLDQWMIQELWSATIFRTSRLEKLMPQLRKFYFPTDYLFYFDLDVETAASRIASRTNGRSRFDKMRPEQRIIELNKYHQYLYGLYLHAEGPEKHKLSTHHDPAQNGELFCERLASVLTFSR